MVASDGPSPDIQKDEAPPEALPLFDGQRFDAMVESLGRRRMIDLCAVAAASIAESVEALRGCRRNDDAAGVGLHAHRLHGVAANYGCLALAALARQIEADCHAPQACGEQFDRLVAATLAALPRESREG